jgi:hypothetical protein
MQLPRPLEPWSAWLALLPPDLAAPLGQMLLRMQPLLGRMASVVPSRDAMPVGVGSIARRGPYERLLLSEWAYADAAPDEFLRRAASNELLFSAPEPQAQRRSRLCLALFDAGPAQLGEPRLAQLALFILLARRAEEAGAAFQWGILQTPGKLHDSADSGALRTLLQARTLACVGSAHLAAWDASLAAVEGAVDVWQVSAPEAGTPARVTARVTIEQPLLDARLRIEITQHRTTRQLMLDLPAPDCAVRLLRHPFRDPVEKGRMRTQGAQTLSLKYAPRFSLNGHWLAVTAAPSTSLCRSRWRRGPASRGGRRRRRTAPCWPPTCSAKHWVRSPATATP